MKLRDYRAKLEFVSDNIESFDEYRDLGQSAKRQKREELNTHRDRVSDAMQLIADSADECVDDSKQCKIPPLSDDLFKPITLPKGLTTDLPTRISGTSVTVPTKFFLFGKVARI
ncbi:hypothetical protein [Leptodesmis sp.]|uniref:hypothetical protein n=1 Tax=Leptodesmis sp. TaxID=3100501 RepID=UPI0040534E20